MVGVGWGNVNLLKPLRRNHKSPQVPLYVGESVWRMGRDVWVRFVLIIYREETLVRPETMLQKIVVRVAFNKRDEGGNQSTPLK
jgi:hypothetical protein